MFASTHPIMLSRFFLWEVVPPFLFGFSNRRLVFLFLLLLGPKIKVNLFDLAHLNCVQPYTLD